MAVESNKKRKLEDADEPAPESPPSDHDGEEEAAEEIDNKGKGKKATQSKGKGKSTGTGTGSGNGSRTSWTDDRDTHLSELVKKKNDEKGDWKSLLDQFNHKYPDDNKTMKAVKARWEKIKGGTGDELSDEQKKVFKKTAEEIRSKKVSEAELIALRFNAVTNGKLSKHASLKLLKAMQNWKLGSSAKTDASEDGDQAESQDEKSAGKDNIYDEEGEEEDV